MGRTRYLIVGDGAAGVSAAEAIRARDPHGVIALFSDDPHPCYYRAALTNFLLGELREDQLWAVTPAFFDRFQVHRVFSRVEGVDPARGLLWCSGSAQPEAFDRLLIASGARSRQPSFPGAELYGVVTLRRLHDAYFVLERMQQASGLSRAVVLGGGPLGLELAHALRERGAQVTIIERAERLLPRTLDKVASDLLAARLRQAGIQVLVNEQVAHAVAERAGSVGGVVTASGHHLPCELVAAAIGVDCNTEFLHGSGVELTDRGAVLANAALQTSKDRIYAAGDVASVEGFQPQLWQPARLQGRVAGANMAGLRERYAPGAHYFATRLFDLDFASVGSLEPGPGCVELARFPQDTGKIEYQKLVFEGPRLVGALLLGERSTRVRAAGRNLQRLIETRADISDCREDLLDPGFDVAAWLETRRLLERPEAAPQTQARPAPRGTRQLSLSMLGVGAPAGGAVPGGTAVLAAAAAAATYGSGGNGAGPLAPGTLAIDPGLLAAARGRAEDAAPRRGTRQLSIGLWAEAPAPARSELAGLDAAPLEAALELNGQRHPVGGAALLLGRAEDCGVRIDDAHASRRHAELRWSGNALYLRDLGGSAGTWLNGERLGQPRALQDGDHIRIGQTTLVVRAPGLGKTRAERADPSGSASEPCVEITDGALAGLVFRLGQREQTTIGRAPESTVRLEHPTVSRRHALIRLSPEGWHLLSDAGSVSGTWLDGAQLPARQEAPLRDGSQLRVGAVGLTYTLRARESPTAALRSKPVLNVMSGSRAGTRVPLREGTNLVIGSAPRSAGASLALADPAIPPEHVELAWNSGGLWVRALTPGGAFLRGAPLASDWTAVQAGDTLLLASTMLGLEELS